MDKTIHITILAEKRGLFVQAFKSIEKTAEKFGVSKPTLTISEEYQKEIEIKQPNSGALVLTELYNVCDAVINVEAIFKLNGDYSLYAIIDHTTHSHKILDIDHDIPTQYQDMSDMTCEHCNKKISRTKSFILNDSAGSFIKVGRSCMKSFLGLNPENFVSVFDVINGFKTQVEGLEPKPVRVGNVMNTIHNMNTVITLADRLITSEGYIKKTYNDANRRTNQGEATADKLETLLFDKEVVLNTTTDERKISKIRNYFETLPLSKSVSYKDDAGDKITEDVDISFNKSLVKLYDRSRATLFEAFTVCAGINSYYTHLEHLKKLESDRKSVWIGTVGQKTKLRLTLVDIKSGIGEYGVWKLWILEDENGNIFKKFGSLNSKFAVASSITHMVNGNIVDDVFEFMAEIKEHSEHNGVKTTLLGRLTQPK